MSLKHFLVLFFLVAASRCAFVPALVEVGEDGEVVDVHLERGHQSDAHRRLRRQTSPEENRRLQFEKSLGLGKLFGQATFMKSGGVLGSAGYTAPIISSPSGNLQGTAQASKVFGVPGGPTNFGGQLSWAGKAGSASAGVDHMLHGPTTMNLGASVPVWKPNSHTDLSVGGSFSKQFGPGAVSQPNYNVGATFTHHF